MAGTPPISNDFDIDPAGAERFAERRRRLAALRGRLLAAAVVTTLLLWAAMFYGLVSEHLELVGHVPTL